MPDTISLHDCGREDLETVKRHISELCLDDMAMEPEQFIIAKHKGEIYGFGRLRTYDDCQDLCSLGVIEPERMKGIGRAVAKALIEKSTRPLYVVTVIPEFFRKLGFETVDAFPEGIARKLGYCKASLWVPEPYAVMKLR